MKNPRTKAGRLAMVFALALGLILTAQAAWAQDALRQKASTEIQERTDPTASGAPVPAYHGNTKTKRFHRSGCRYFYCKHCTAVFKTREEAIKAAYIPCKVCKP